MRLRLAYLYPSTDRIKTFSLQVIFAAFVIGIGFHSARAQKATVSGILKTSKGNPIPLASVAVFDSTSSRPVMGIASDSTGRFSLKIEPGSYTVRITFLSYKPFTKALTLGPGEDKSLGIITMHSKTASMEDVVVEGKQSQMELTFEKRVFQVGKDISVMGGSVLDVLNNVPSLMADFKGNVSLRGSNAVQILINGKPSSIYTNGSKALQGLPADMIKEVEVITNPSAKYQAEGSAGIINIILKKNEDRGFNGNVGVMQRYPEATQVTSNLNYRQGAVNWFLNGSVAYNRDPAHSRALQRFNSADTSYIYREINDGRETDFHGQLQAGADLHLPHEQTLTLEGLWQFESKTDFWNGAYVDSTFSGALLDRTKRHNRIGGGEQGNELALDYENQLSGEEHTLTASATYEYGLGKELPHIWEMDPQNPADTLYHQVDDISRSHHLTFRTDLVQPITGSSNLEAGLRSNYTWNDNNYTTKVRQNNESWNLLPAFNNNYAAYETLNAAYATLSSELDSFSAKVGLRMEQYHIQTQLNATGARTSQTYLNLFPSAFITYDFNEQRSVQLSYSRRISRPYTRLLLPTTNYSDSRSRFTGNPDLNPEFANSYDVEFLQYWETGSLLTSFYYRHRLGVIRNIARLDSDGIMRTVPINLSSADAWGVEMTAEKEFTDDLKLSAGANLFQSKSKGYYNGQSYQASTNRFTGRLQLQWNFLSGLKFQTAVRYYGPEKTIQGHRASTTFVNLAIAKDFFDGAATLSLNSEDLFNTRRERYTINDPQYFSRQKFWEPNGLRVNFTYRINQEKGEEE